MNKNKLLELAAKSKMLRGLAFNLCNGRDIHNDLFQEFLLRLLQKEEEFLIKKYNDIQFISYCSNTIKGLNSMRWRDTKATNTKNPLVERHQQNYFEEIEIVDENYNEEIDFKYKKTVSLLKNIKGSELLIKSIESTTREVAEQNNLNQRKLIYQNVKIKQLVKNKIK